MMVEGYYITDPDGLAYFAVPIQKGGMWGQNLTYLTAPNEYHAAHYPEYPWRRRKAYVPKGLVYGS